MSFVVVIPARYASQRLPGKPLLDIAGKTMIERVYQQAQKSAASNIVVATDHTDIEKAVLGFGGQVCMTREDHASGTDRLTEVVEKLGLADDDVVVNVQGDEPLIPPSVINQVAENLRNNTQASVATVCESILDAEKYQNANAVKVVSDKFGMAMYFSRAPIPWSRDHLSQKNNERSVNAFLSERAAVNVHIGIYAYRVSLLKEFVTWPLATLESIEKLEQLRVMENGHRIHVAAAIDAVPGGVDTPEDLDKVRGLFL